MHMNSSHLLLDVLRSVMYLNTTRTTSSMNRDTAALVYPLCIGNEVYKIAPGLGDIEDQQLGSAVSIGSSCS